MQGNINFIGDLSGSITGEGGGSTVSIDPTLTSGTKIADFEIDGESGELYAPSGSGGVTPVISATATVDDTSGDPEVNVVKTGTDEAPSFAFNFTGINGVQGQNGTDGTSAYATVTKSGDTATIICTDDNGTTTATVSDGENGADGSDGTSAYATVTKSGDTATITCTDANGTTTASVSDGHNGANGTDGSSAYASVSKVGSTATITFTDANGTTTATVSDGTNGQGVPSGGTSGQYLKKDSSTDYDTSFANIQASEVSYDNTSSGMTATTSQGAIDELNSSLTELNTRTTLYDDDNILLIKRGYTYCLTMFGATYSDFQTALTTIQQYLPETASFSLVSDLQGKRYLAPAFISNNSVTIQIVGTYNSSPTNWASATSHVIYGTMTWIR